MRNCMSIAMLVPIVAACSPAGPGPIAGGPCKYETSMITGTVTEVGDDNVLMMGEDGEFRVQVADFRNPPAVGDTLTLQRQLITEGTCTPEIYAETVGNPD